MLVVGRKVHETIAISNDIRITVHRIRGNQVRLGIAAPEDLEIIREELLGPTDPGPEAGESPILRSSEGTAIDGDPLQGRSRGGPHRGQGLRSARSPGERPRG
jgi:carbon storage regulator